MLQTRELGSSPQTFRRKIAGGAGGELSTGGVAQKIVIEPLDGRLVRDTSGYSTWVGDGIRIRTHLGAALRNHSAVRAWVIKSNCRAPNPLPVDVPA